MRPPVTELRTTTDRQRAVGVLGEHQFNGPIACKRVQMERAVGGKGLQRRRELLALGRHGNGGIVPARNCHTGNIHDCLQACGTICSSIIDNVEYPVTGVDDGIAGIQEFLDDRVVSLCIAGRINGVRQLPAENQEVGHAIACVGAQPLGQSILVGGVEHDNSACAPSTISSISRLAAVCDHQFAWAEIAMPMFDVGGTETVEDKRMSSIYTVPEPPPCTPMVKEVTLLRFALVPAKTMFHLCQPAIPMSVAGPS